MKAWQDFVLEQTAACASVTRRFDRPRVQAYGDVTDEYRVIASGSALVDRTDRGLLEIRGSDRASWLHNLTTNEVKSLTPGTGNNAFAPNLQGRILFDLNILIREDCIWVDLDRIFLDRAMKHFGRYRITEDVRVIDRSNEFVRLGLVGERAGLLLAEHGVADPPAMPALSAADVSCGDVALVLIRHDFCGPFGVELFVPAERAVDVWRNLSDPAGPFPATPVGDEAVQVHRIEAGLPWPGSEITDEVLPAETGRLDRVVSFTKGCYLGHEVVERMRSRGVVARQLVGFIFEGDGMPPPGASLFASGDQPDGKLTSVCRSVAVGRVIGLGFLKSAHIEPGTSLRARWDGGSTVAVVAALPFATGGASRRNRNG